MTGQIQIDREAITDFARRHHICRLALFGSVTRDDFGPQSDVDVLVAFEPGQTPGFELFDMQDELERLLGRKVDLLTTGFLSPYIRGRVEREAVVLYDIYR